MLGISSINGWAQSLWSVSELVHNETPASNSYHVLPADFHVWSGRKYELPIIPNSETFAGNAGFIEKLAERAPIAAVDIWIDAQLGINWNASHDSWKEAGKSLYWDYLMLDSNNEVSTREQRENAGNFNYYVTGHTLFKTILEKVGIKGNYVNTSIDWTLRIGGGLYQLMSDVVDKKFDKVDHTWYGEEKKDAIQMDAAARYVEYLKIEKIARSVGVNLNPEDFGIVNKITTKSEYHLSNDKLDFEQYNFDESFLKHGLQSLP